MNGPVFANTTKKNVIRRYATPGADKIINDMKPSMTMSADTKIDALNCIYPHEK
jgi:hypothetical protein